MTIEELEAANPGISDERLDRWPEAGRPFGFQSNKWEAMKAAMQPGDELVSFCSAPETWKALCGRAGIVLIRKGRPVMEIVTMMN